ncbi:dynamin family protein-like protein [Pleomassaria siparia CBS 279.74]|uniref:Dynamin family protein-like protein n=1 Tax=Pleomassaria siparia CBS 279.74 TaxID=1314801 RepID=A0A6G1K623_9PLEO|nr:dynamin family protein-like protein [Pleomassaria siparia CBS 279.74]
MASDSSNSVRTPSPEPPLDPEGVTTDSLEALQSDGQRRILDIVDQLRRQGLNSLVELPQLVVVGDQSSGKSSVLEAITEIPFPRKENLCTRFATEIILRRNAIPSISTRITPDKGRTLDEQTKLRAFKRVITDFTELPRIIDQATNAMGLEEVGTSDKAFARDVLTVEISGPSRPQLTLVDLPGLIHAANKMQSEDDVKLIGDLVIEYMKNPRTIILAVISAKNDYANQIIIKHCKTIDPTGRRTLGIITKPDYLTEGSAYQQSWLDLAQNKDIHFDLGWHMVKNRSEDEGNKSFAQRNKSERQFFSTGKYDDLPNECKGIETLRSRLSNLLHNHLKTELPHLKTELSDKLSQTAKELQQLGVSRNTIAEQRMFLTDISQKINEILKAAIKGQYENDFFGPVNMKASVNSLENIRRFRAVVQHLNLEFSDQLLRAGHKYSIPAHKGKNSTTTGDNDKNAEAKEGHLALSQPIKMTRNEAIDWVHHVLERSRGLELPGNFNPLIISQLFWEQSSPWNEATLHHVDLVSSSCKTFVDIVLDEAAPKDIKDRLLDSCVDTALQASLKGAKEELAKIIQDKGRHPMTYNQVFTTKIQEQRKSKYAQIFSNLAKAASVSWTKEGTEVLETYIDPKKLDKDMEGGIEQNMDKFSAEDALDSQLAYYADALKFFINCVTTQVIERHLVDTLANNVFSPRTVAGMTDDQIRLLAAEAGEVTSLRNRLEVKKGILEKGLKIFREAMGGFS